MNMRSIAFLEEKKEESNEMTLTEKVESEISNIE